MLTPGLGLLASRAVSYTFLLFAGRPVYSILLEQADQAKILPLPQFDTVDEKIDPVISSQCTFLKKPLIVNIFKYKDIT